jgi:hypothetical protein
MRSIVRRVYWKVIAVIARISRSVQALNEGFAPQGSASTGPHQPLSALRDTVSVLGAVTGRLESRVESLALSSSSLVERLIHAVSVSELTRAAPDAKLTIIGDRTGMRVAEALHDLGRDVFFYGSAHDESAQFSPQLAAGVLGTDAVRHSDIIAVIVASNTVPALVGDAASAALATDLDTRLITCLPAVTGAERSTLGAGRPTAVEERMLPASGFITGSPAMTSVVLTVERES